MKIYTKKGDSGKTQLLGGNNVSKNHIRIQCYGAIDELNAFIGNLYDQKLNKNHKLTLLDIQNQLFNLGAIISSDQKNKRIKLPRITDKKVQLLEKEIDKMEKKLPVLKTFILPSGDDIASKCHIARTVCRRVERSLVTLGDNCKVNPLHLTYINRLSDYLFVLSRDILSCKKIKEVVWQKK